MEITQVRNNMGRETICLGLIVKRLGFAHLVKEKGKK